MIGSATPSFPYLPGSATSRDIARSDEAAADDFRSGVLAAVNHGGDSEWE